MRYFKSLRGILTLLGVLGLVVYLLLPAPVHTELLFPHGTLQKQTPFAIDDSSMGLSSRAYKSVSDSLLSFDCILASDTLASVFCSFGWDLGSVRKRNWSNMDSIIFEMKVSGMDEIVLKLFTYDPNHKEFARHLVKEIKVFPGWNRIVIAIDMLYTPDYWFADNQIPKGRGTNHLEAVERLEISPGWHAPRAKPLGIQIRKIEVMGFSNMYFGLLVAWELVLIIIALGVRTNIRRRE